MTMFNNEIAHQKSILIGTQTLNIKRLSVTTFNITLSIVIKITQHSAWNDIQHYDTQHNITFGISNPQIYIKHRQC
jgi:hypothetical protein